MQDHPTRATSITSRLLWLVAFAALLASCAQVRDVAGSGGGNPLSSFGVSPVAGDAPLPVTASWGLSGAATECQISFGDGSPAQTVGGCEGGSVDHVYVAPGAYTVTITVEAPGGHAFSRSASVHVTDPGDPAQNHAPSVNGFTAAPSSGDAPLPVTLSWSASDPDGDALTCTVQPSDGSPAIVVADCAGAADAAHTFTSPGTYKVTLLVSDGRGGSTSGETTVTVTAPGGGQPPENQDPEIGDLEVDPHQGTAPVTVTVSWDASDPDGDPLACSVDFGDGTSETVSPCQGGQELSHTYATPGHYVVTVTVTDGKGGAGTRTAGVNVTVEPSALVSTGTSLLEVDGGDTPLLDAMVAGLLGDTAGIGVVSWNGLAAVDADGLALLQVFEDVAGVDGWEELLEADLGLADIAEGIARLVPDPGLSAELRTFKDAALVGLGGQVSLGDLVDAGDVPAAELWTVMARTDLDLLDLFVGSLQLYNRSHVGLAEMAGVELPLAAGLSAVDVVTAYVSVTEPPQLLLAREGAAFSSSALRLELIVGLDEAASPLTGAVLDELTALLNVPLTVLLSRLEASVTLTELGLYLDVAPAQGTVTAIDAQEGTVGFELAPGAAELRLGRLDPADRAAFFDGAPLDTLSFGAAVIGAAELDVINAIAGGSIGGIELVVSASGAGTAASSAPVGVTVTALPGVARVGTSSVAVAELVSELVSSLEVEVEVGGSSGAIGVLVDLVVLVLGDVGDTLQGAVATLVSGSPVVPVLADVLDPALEALGVRIGEAAATVWGISQ